MKTEQLFSVKDKTALVTGSTGGLGSMFAKGLAENGCRVLLNSRSREKLDRQIREFSEQGFQVSGYAFDVTDTDQVQAAFERIHGETGALDILVNNAGAMHRAPLEEFSDEDWDRVVGINLTGTFKVSRAAAKGMIAKGAGKIINIGSMQSELGRYGIAPYAASKGGIKMLTKGMATDWARHNIQVNGIGPGYFKTDMTRALYEDPEMNAWLCGRTPAGRWGDEEELLGALFFLASRAGSYMNGHMIYVDGGLLATV